MKNAPTTNSNESALDKRDYNIGKLPAPRGTAIAGVLAYLLEETWVLTAEHAYDYFGTNRLSAIIRTLEKKYGWEIARYRRPVFPAWDPSIPAHEDHPDLDAWALAAELGQELPDEAFEWLMKPYEGMDLEYELAYGLPYAMVQAARSRPDIVSWLNEMKSVTSPKWYGGQMTKREPLAKDLAPDNLSRGEV